MLEGMGWEHLCCQCYGWVSQQDREVLCDQPRADGAPGGAGFDSHKDNNRDKWPMGHPAGADR